MTTLDSSTQVSPAWTESELVHTSLPVLRQSWLFAAELAADRKMPGLRAVVEQRLTRVAAEQLTDEATLISMAEECQAMVAVVASDPVADEIGRKLRRGVYEYLLAIDARRTVQREREESVGTDAPIEVPVATVDVATIRRVVGEHLQNGRYADCAAMLTRVTRNQRGADLAELACAAGRACRAAGERRAAAECFQASCAADPEYEGTAKLGAAR